MAVTEMPGGESELVLTLQNPIEDQFGAAISDLRATTTKNGPPRVAMHLIRDPKGRVEASLDGTVDLDARFRAMTDMRRPTEKPAHQVKHDVSIKTTDRIRPENAPRVQAEERNVNTRLPRDQLEMILFGCFEEQSNWKMEALRQHTKQPVEWLRTVLNDLCVNIKRGPHKNTYQLKKEHGGPDVVEE